MRKKTLHEELPYFTGSANLYQHWSGRLVYSEGVRFLAEEAAAYWLVDAIASHQPGVRRLMNWQLWTLVVRDDRSGLLQCRRTPALPAILKQEIPFTDLLLEFTVLFVEEGLRTPTLLLPSEH